jgi:Tfp pilus assembly protein PilV
MKKLYRYQGVGLIEVLIALALLTFGALGLVRMQTHFRWDADHARQRLEAVRLAQSDIEQLRHALARGQADALQNHSSSVTSGLAAVYRVERQVEPSSSPRTHQVQVQVTWPDRADPQQVRRHHILLTTLLTSEAAMLQGLPALNMLRPSISELVTIVPRSPRIPAVARELGDGRSAWKPFQNDPLTWVFNQGTGDITHQCQATSPTLSTQRLQADNLQGCVVFNGLLMTGHIHFTNAIPPNPRTPNDPPRALRVSVQRTDDAGLATASCAQQIMQTSNRRGISYHCVIPTLGSPPSWSGRLHIEPQGWNLGITRNDHKVCRYTASPTTSWPLSRTPYQRVTRHLMQENFLVVQGDQICPGLFEVQRLTGREGTIQTQLSTEPYQP